MNNSKKTAVLIILAIAALAVLVMFFPLKEDNFDFGQKGIESARISENFEQKRGLPTECQQRKPSKGCKSISPTINA